jgi:spore coat protein U-like protein
MAALMLVGLHLTASAATGTASLGVTATVVASCSVTGSSVAFGNYTSSQLDQSTNVAVLCTTGTTYTVGLDAGVGSGASTSVRKMTGPGGATLSYQLSRDVAHATNWGNAVGTDTSAGIGTGLSQNVTVYGRIPSGQLPGAGSYTDTVTVTLTY